MNELIAMFRHPKMIKNAAFCAAVFALMAVLFKNSIVLIPEVTEVRPVNMLALAFGLMFGPAGAVGCAVGNLIGDFSGSLTILTVYGFIGNFFSAYLPYKIWDALGGDEFLQRPSFRSPRAGRRLAAAILMSVASCSAVLALSFDYYNALPALNTFNMIFLNNIAATVVLGLPLLALVTLLPPEYVPYWKETMADEGYAGLRPPSARRMRIAAAMTVLALVFVLIMDRVYNVGLSGSGEFGLCPVIIGLSLYTACFALCGFTAGYGD
ncbi:MAG: QueT transporter family protein [Syntrophomonadaceae bacterium]|nr:QueT transporter family protein [Syntrophomonadaceae bacterium]